jgi:hypothetical protein
MLASPRHHNAFLVRKMRAEPVLTNHNTTRAAVREVVVWFNSGL